jgi:iron complex transport system substrate-binding protein
MLAKCAARAARSQLTPRVGNKTDVTLALTCALILTAACTPPPTTKSATKPRAIVSLDYCADQFVLALADREQIKALSTDAEKPFAYLAKRAAGLPKVRPLAEDVLALKPDLVVRSYGGGPLALGQFERAGIAVAQLGYGEDFLAIKANVRDMADNFGHTARGAQLVGDMEARLSAIKPPSERPSALYLTPSGVSTGAGTLIDAMLTHAGLRNFQAQAGWNPISLERLAYEVPDVIITTRFDQAVTPTDQWSSARHPVMRQVLHTVPNIAVQGSTTACNGWFVVDAVEAMAGGLPAGAKP